MAVLVRNISATLDIDEERDLAPLLARTLRVGRGSVTVRAVIKRSLDTRRGREPRYLYTVAVDLPSEIEAAVLSRKRSKAEAWQPTTPIAIAKTTDDGVRRPIVIGAGPAGLFATYRLVQAGLRPIVIDRGLAVTERGKKWHHFLNGGPFDSESNLLFGEGGAGAFSDGKLYTRVKDPRVHEVLDVLVAHGAPGWIAYDAKPHVGSNLLPSIVRRLRADLIARGAEFRFSTVLRDVRIDAGRLVAIDIESLAESKRETLEPSALFVGIGHSARDTLRMLADRGVPLERKPFQMGVRVEHPQAVIDRIQYREYTGNAALPPADYRFVEKTTAGDVFSFCMCPGGEILPSTEKPGFICVNGASPFKRRGDFANSGFVVTITPDRFEGYGVMAGIEMQERVERSAAAVVEHPFGAPANRLADFLAGRVTKELPPHSYPFPLTPASFRELLPSEVHDAIRRGLAGLAERVPAFGDPLAIVTAPESRSSCPVRMLRDEDYQSAGLAGLYPVGEGAGYAGGIMSAAIDGMRSVEAWLARRGS